MKWGKKIKYESKWSFIGELSNATLHYNTCHGSRTIIFGILDMDTILVIIDMIGCEWWKKKKKNIYIYIYIYKFIYK